MVELVPVAETAQRFLVLLLKGMCVYVVECLKRTAGHGECLATVKLEVQLRHRLPPSLERSGKGGGRR